jgi:hypothetical protein
MLRAIYPEVLTTDWLPPTALARHAEVQRLLALLDPDFPPSGPARVAAVNGPRGSGTSIIARRAAREVVDRLRTGRGGPPPLTSTVRVRWCRGTMGVATALVQQLDEGFHGRGFPVVEILAGYLRRLRRANRPTLVILEDIDVGGPSVVPILRAFHSPDRFLPEGESGLPPMWVVLAGVTEQFVGLARELPDLELPDHSVGLREYSREEIFQIVEERARRALAGDPPPELALRVTNRVLRDGGGARRAMELLRRELSIPTTLPPASMGPLTDSWSRGNIEPRVLWALDRACQGATASVAVVRDWEARFARETGHRPLAATTFWRRMIRLEQAGVVRREVRPGGDGGTRTMIQLLVPVEDWAKSRAPPETRRGFGGVSAGPWAAVSGPPRRRERGPGATSPWTPFDRVVPARVPTRPIGETSGLD